ncbi:MAG: glycosyltransferase family 2 protein [Bdellovibrionota bacterium]|nr:glycosyltransferase family 2 protein [Bdellovibrionota bacterium]
MRKYLYSRASHYISSFCQYYDKLWHLDRCKWDDGLLYKKIRVKEKTTVSLADFPQLEEGDRDAILINGNLNYSYDIQTYLEELYKKSSRSTRIVCVLYNYYLSALFSLATSMGIRKGPLPKTFITQVDLENICRLSGYEICYEKNIVHLPFSLLGIGTLINKFLSLIPFVKHFTLLSVAVLRPVKEAQKKSLSILVPARNEKGNIENAVKRIPEMGVDIEVIYVEGNSSDNTWEEIQRVAQDEQYTKRFKIKTLQQPGKGKYDAVRTGFAVAENDILIILDADLTMPPELLPQFMNAYYSGKGDFINGSRLVYPMEGEAMRFLNLLGNKFFAKALSILLDFKLSDSLCGTKILSRRDWLRLVEWRKNFGDYDPFGDFDLLFAAAELKMGIINVPIRYLDREYGSPQISRFRDGAILLKMTLIALFKIKLKNI